MASKNQVTLTFAGDDTKLSQTFSRVGENARKMDTDVGSASRNVGTSFDTVGEAADGAEGKAQGFSDTLTGTKDVMGGVGEIAKGNLFEGFVQAGQGMADLAGGMASFLIPALKNGVTWIKSTTVAQKALNVAMRLNPIGLVITALTLLVGGFILAYKKSETFRNIVNGAFGAVKNVAQAVGRFFTGTLWPGIQSAWNGISSGARGARDLVVGALNSIVSFAKSVPGKVGGFFKGVGSVVSAPFRAGFNAVRNFWNNTIGGKGFDIPGWVPEIGGKSFRIPYFHTGGIVPGGLGSETLAMVRAGERITATSGGGSGTTLVIKSDGSKLADALIEVLKKAIRVQGGDVQVVLGS